MALSPLTHGKIIILLNSVVGTTGSPAPDSVGAEGPVFNRPWKAQGVRNLRWENIHWSYSSPEVCP